MKNKAIIISLFILILFASLSFTFAEDNQTVGIAATELEEVSIDDHTDVLGDSEITITDDNYDTYFNKYNGKLKNTVSNDITTVKIGNVSDKLFTFDRPVNVMPSTSDVQIRDGVIHLISGSSGSNITNLIINNTKGEIYADGLFVSKLHGIWFTNSSDNYIFNNTIHIPLVEGCYAMPMGHSNRNKILYNDIVSECTSCLVMGLCDYNNISYNKIRITNAKSMVTSNLIYFNCFGHADYSGPADCVGTYISNNYLEGYDNSEWCFVFNMMGRSDNTVFINNTVVRGYNGIYAYDWWNVEYQAINVTIINNTVINSTVSITSADNNVIIANNTLIGSSMQYGISVCGDEIEISNVTLCNNYIEFKNLACGIIVLPSNKIIKDNTIKISNYGSGISVLGENSIVENNFIDITADTGVHIFSSNVSVVNNYISTFGDGVRIISEKHPDGTIEKYYNNSIVGNTILSDKYAVYIRGFVFNTSVSDNLIETNQSEAFCIDIEKTFDDKNPGEFIENTVNGVIENTETLIIDDNNFYDYFDEEGYLKYEFKLNSKKMLFFTHLNNKDIYLTDKIILSSNKMPNLLYNVSITFKGDASKSEIYDFNFYNFDKSSIILDGVDNLVIKNNEFTTITDDSFEINTISVIGGCFGCKIVNNNIYMKSKADYTYGVFVSEPSHSIIKRFSRNFTISNNNILIKSEGVSEGMYFDALVESDILKNSINIISEGSAYGISLCDVMGTLHNLKLDSNEIFVNSKDMSYLIEVFRCNNTQITNNYLSGFSNGVYGIGIYNSQGTLITNNEINVCGLNLTASGPADALGKGNSAIYITRHSQIVNILDNVFDCENTSIITLIDSEINQIGKNSYVISDYNHDLYFDGENKLLNDTVKQNDTILFKDILDSKTMDISIPVNITSYNLFNEFKADLILSDNATGSEIFDLNFNGGNLILNNVSSIIIFNNTFLSSNIFDINGHENNISNNEFLNLSTVNVINSSSSIFAFNNVSVQSEFINIINSNCTLVSNNLFESNNTVIKSKDALYNSILNNTCTVNASYGYYAINTHFDNISSNYILIDYDNPTAVYYTGNSSNNNVNYNKIISHSKEGLDYAVVVDSNISLGNVITNNYLVASNGYKRGDEAVNASFDIVHNNTPVVIYVSVNGSDDGDGSLENPYSTIKKAVENSLSGAIIHILPGMYNESGIVIDKNITLTAENIEGNTYINALNNQLFNITPTGILTVNALKIFNGFCVEGGALFNNLGTLIINNCLIYNSSSYYDNSDPTFTFYRKISKYLSYDCSNLGLGGAILNYGTLLIDSSNLFDNYAHKGGAIADFGKTTIRNSLLFNNSATHGGAIFTDSNDELTIENSEFVDNLAMTTLDHCRIQRTETTYFGYRYVFTSACEANAGHGGAIYAQSSVDIKDSLFENNYARCGGAIAYYSKAVDKYDASSRKIDYLTNEENPFPSTYNLNIKNSVFRGNEARDTQCGNLSLLKMGRYDPTYAQNCHGGAIFGSLNEFNLVDCLFEHDSAYDNGGAVCVQVQNSTIEGSKFYNNTAGAFGGALDIFGDFILFNSDISSNNAKFGGAMQYSSYSYYARVQKNFNAFNVTISQNMALEKGGAIIVSGNMAIKNSNIYGNTAPEGSTISGSYRVSTDSKLDLRNNWWGSPKGPDDSVLNQRDVRYKKWQSDKVNWNPVSIKPSVDDDKNKENGNNGKSSIPTVSTGSSVHTGSTLTLNTPSSTTGNGNGFNFNGNWPSGNNKGNFGGLGDGDGVNPYKSSGKSKTDVNGNIVNPNGLSKTDVNGNIVNPNSLSKTNSSSVNNLDSVGMTANAADSSTTGQSSSSEGSAGDSQVAYEVTKEIRKDIVEPNKYSNIYLILFILVCLLFFAGFYRRYERN